MTTFLVMFFVCLESAREVFLLSPVQGYTSSSSGFLYSCLMEQASS